MTSRERASFAPDVPTIYEAGFPALAVETTAGLYGPRSMPRELRERFAKDVIAVVSDPVITERLVATGQAINLGGPEELAQDAAAAGRADGDGREGARPQSRQVRPRRLAPRRRSSG